MRCPRCGKEDPADFHTCTPIAMRYVDELRRHGTVIDHVGCAAEIVRLYEESVRLTAPQPQPDHFRDATEKVDDTALLRQALEALELVQADVKTTPNAYEAQRQAIATLRERLK